MVSGKELRLSRVLRSGKMLCVPMDHGVSMGPITGITKIGETIQKLERGGATAVVLHKGILKALGRPPELGLIMHMSASTSLGPYPNWKVGVASVTEAILLGADAVSVHVNLGNKREHEMLEEFGRVVDEADSFGVPVLAMMYARGENIPDPLEPEAIAHVVRVGAEIGADVVKTPYTGDPDTFKGVVEGSPVPVVIAGGPKVESDRDVLEMVVGATQAGAVGVSIGRNIFQREDPIPMLKAISGVLLEGLGIDESVEVLEKWRRKS